MILTAERLLIFYIKIANRRVIFESNRQIGPESTSLVCYASSTIVNVNSSDM